MCAMLSSHPYFNLATNIVNFIIPFLNNWDPKIRSVVFNTIKGIFAKDKRGEISYEVSLHEESQCNVGQNVKYFSVTDCAPHKYLGQNKFEYQECSRHSS
jgi:hypothetical protein